MLAGNIIPSHCKLVVMTVVTMAVVAMEVVAMAVVAMAVDVMCILLGFIFVFIGYEH